MGDGVIRDEGANYEVESQFILRLPPLPAASLKAVVQSGVLNLKDRLNVQIEQDMRHGTVRFDGWTLPSKIIDLPCVIESHKTLDRKNFYKTADICQMMICREDGDDDREERKEDKMKDGRDRRFVYPHGITPPLKNVRKKRFRKTLKKKVVDVPEIEKEVKRLFRTDNEAFTVRYELVNADDEKIDTATTAAHNANSQSVDLVEHDLFGEVLSSSEDDEDDDGDDRPRTDRHRTSSTSGMGAGPSGSGVGGALSRGDESDENSRMSMGLSKDVPLDSRFGESAAGRFVTEFSKGMLLQHSSGSAYERSPDQHHASHLHHSHLHHHGPISETSVVTGIEPQDDSELSYPSASQNMQLVSYMSELEQQIIDLQQKRQAQEEEIGEIENLALRQRFQSTIDALRRQEMEKQREYDELAAKLQM